MGAREDDRCRVTDAMCIADRVENVRPEDVVCPSESAVGAGTGGQLVLDLGAPADGCIETAPWRASRRRLSGTGSF